MFKNTIVAAANIMRVTSREGITREITLVDNCHFGRNMQEIIHMLKAFGCEVTGRLPYEDRGQGFIDESGCYHNRSEAYSIVKSSGQPFNEDYLLPNQKLDSSCIRHFKAEVSWEDYMVKVGTSGDQYGTFTNINKQQRGKKL
ncbi:hypothetical protein NVP1063O_045 [Vibrio phage 1.063.O._10N.261.45.C7]|nr:hypothetical protein NVP1063O_045 [Vibrio phage 1.063.O._10N.261.45.C7]